MIETPQRQRARPRLPPSPIFLSIGTNDLVQYTLGLDREQPAASAATAADPIVLQLIAQVVAAAHAAGTTVEVCGEAAGEAEVAALLVGLDVDELSVAPARLDEVREVVRLLSMPDAADR